MSRIAPWLAVSDAERAAAWYRDALGAEVREELADEAGTAVARLGVGEGEWWVAREERPDRARTVLLVDDPEARFARALAAGATEVSPVHEAHGWRIGRLVDPFGHHWELGRREPPPPEPAGWRTVTTRIVAPNAAALVAFAVRVFGAAARRLPDGRIELWIGDTRLLVRDAGPRAPHPAFLFVYVADLDQTWQRAVDAGAVVVERPERTAHGERQGIVRDPQGSTWQIASRLTPG